jgi:hypothetical protein
MEVHHPHVEKKNFKEYLLEGLMIFLAVTMGFFAEQIREHFVEAKREKEYIVSMLKELRSDSVQLTNVFKDTARIKKMDSLSLLLLSRNDSQTVIKSIYRLADYITVYNSMTFSRNTLTQLKNGGNMRFVKNADIVDSLNQLDNLITSINVQLEAYEKITIENIREMYSILDYSLFVKNGKKLVESEVLQNQVIPFLTTDKRKVIEFGSKISFQKSVWMNYFYKLEGYANYSNHLIALLKREYHLENE